MIDVKMFKEKFPHLAHLEGNELWDAMEQSLIKPHIPKEGDDEIVETREIDGYTFNFTKGFVDSIKENFTTDKPTTFENFGFIFPKGDDKNPPDQIKIKYNRL